MPSNLGSGRSDDYRYAVDEHGAEITPLAHVEAFLGNAKVKILNISMGGVALLFEQAPTLSKEDILDISISIRDRAFPVQIEVKGFRGMRVSCSFLHPSRIFQGCLREFLKPKYLGATLTRNNLLSQRDDLKGLVEGATEYEAFIGQNQSGVFVWTGEGRKLLRMVAVSQDLIIEWQIENGVKTGRLPSRSALFELSAKSDDVNISWDRAPDMTLLHYFADIIMAWMGQDEGTKFVDELLSEPPSPENPIKFLHK